MLITHVHLVPVCGVEIPDGFLRTEGRRIAALGPMQELPAPAAGEEVVDGKGGWLLPGLVDIHSHLGMFGDGMGVEGDDGNEIADPVTPQLRAIDAVNPLDRGFSEALDYGVTTVVTGPGQRQPDQRPVGCHEDLWLLCGRHGFESGACDEICPW